MPMRCISKDSKDSEQDPKSMRNILYMLMTSKFINSFFSTGNLRGDL